MIIIREIDFGLDQLAAAFHIHLMRAIDQNVGNRSIGQQRLERSQAHDFVQDVLHQLFAPRRVQRHPGLLQQPFHQQGQLFAQTLGLHRAHHIQIDPAQQLAVQAVLEAVVLRVRVGGGRVRPFRLGRR